MLFLNAWDCFQGDGTKEMDREGKKKKTDGRTDGEKKWKEKEERKRKRKIKKERER